MEQCVVESLIREIPIYMWGVVENSDAKCQVSLPSPAQVPENFGRIRETPKIVAL